ncbi:hypothetical protein G6F50_008414 [Rhizopus delemar]|uniref:Dilute domain-containing protein n=1 Tax=Rhizopus delemar TaxID=936053 RepID=A0A9P6YYN9_9FUNG|nr:hypothetical protein G6F50_008414 [Rhizopus delemar]
MSLQIVYQTDKINRKRLNILAVPSSTELLKDCPSPFVKDTLASIGDGQTTDKTFCLAGCCAPCPLQNFIYKKGWAEKGFNVSNALRFVSAILSFFLVVSYLVLPDKRRHPSLLILNLSIGIFLFSMTSFFAIGNLKRSNKRDVHTLAFWISNLTHLLYYLKKDTALVASAAEHQPLISELVSKAYTALIDDSQKRLDYILESAMLEFEPLDGFDVIHFAHDWQRFFFRRSSSSAFVETISSPTSVTHLLSSILYVLQSYEVHPTIIHQALSQLFHFFSCEMFNRILSNKRMLCRSKALQIRMNLTVIEEWARQQGLTIESHLVPVIQMVQLLQCVSQLTDLVDFIHTIKSFDLLNPIQIKRLIVQYRYEVNERRVPEEIEKYTMQIAEDTIKQYVQEKKTSRNNSMSSLMYEEEEGRVKEKKDSTYMLPFSLPTLISEKVIPVIPEDWLMKLTPLFSP